MAVEFRCEKCGKLLRGLQPPKDGVGASSAEGDPAKIRCPYCKARVQVPEGLASLPSPQVPPDAARPIAQQPVEEEVLVGQDSDALMNVMAAVMPWIISAFLHVGVFVIMAFITIVVFKTTTGAEITVPDIAGPEDPGGPLDPNETSPELRAKSLRKISQEQWSRRDSTIPLANLGETKERIPLYGMQGGSAGQSADFGLTTGGGGGPRSRFLGLGGTAYHIVYVVDRSGSMLDSFDLVRRELLLSISRLSPQQTFHVIFFSSGKPKENGPRRLVPANTDFKRDAAKNLRSINAQGGSPTNPISAIKRAFEVLARAPAGKKGKLIYLLTDGEFHDNEEVRRTIRSLNKNRSVHVNTILYVFRDPEFEKVLRQIADENGGRFKFVERNE